MDTLVTVTFTGLSACAYVINRVANANEKGHNEVPDGDADKLKTKISDNKEKIFAKLKLKFFSAYFLALLGDWLQGPYVYQLYHHYGFKENEIAILFLTGFASSSSFGTFTGPLADKYGRKRLAMVFAVVYGLCCAIKLSNCFWVLLMGRVMGGVSTSLLFSVFESWYVKQHVDVHKLDPEWLSKTFATSTFANGLLAILAGLMANLLAETLNVGPIAPFMMAIPCFALCFVIVALTWEENHGNQETHLIQSYKEGFHLIWNNEKILLLGSIQSIIESCMYIFVFLWTPVLGSGSDQTVPLGLIFSSFMVCIMIGSSAFSIALNKEGLKPRDTLLRSIVIFAFCTLICSFIAGPNIPIALKSVCFLTFLLLEFSIGIYFPSIGCLRSANIPESHRATVSNWFRVPMNLITCFTLLAVNHPAVAEDKRCIFVACTLLLSLGVWVTKKFIGLDKIKAQ